jgi:hypothetical protein
MRNMCRVKMKCMDKLQELVPHIKTRKFISVCVCKQFARYGSTFVCLGPFDFCLWGRLNASCIQLQLKMERHFSAFFMPADHLPLPQDLGRGVTVQDQTCPFVHWFRWRTFWAFLRHICKIVKSDSVTHVHLSDFVEQLGSHWIGFDETWYLSFFKNLLRKFKSH